MKISAWQLVLWFVVSSQAFGHGGGEAELEVGADKGVIEVTSDKSFKLSEEAKKTLGIDSVPYQAGMSAIPKNALVTTLKESQIFRVRDGYLKAIHVPSRSKDGKSGSVPGSEFKSGDQIVIRGTGFLRIIAAQLGESESSESGHDHGSEGEDHHD